MAHPDSDGAAEMLEGGHRALSTAALRLAELYAQRMQIYARLREQQARVAADTDRRHTTIAAAAAQMLRTGNGRFEEPPRDQSTDRDTVGRKQFGRSPPMSSAKPIGKPCRNWPAPAPAFPLSTRTL